jgi:hypothetical protein
MKTSDFILQGWKSKLTIKVGTENILFYFLLFGLLLILWALYSKVNLVGFLFWNFPNSFYAHLVSKIILIPQVN